MSEKKRTQETTPEPSADTTPTMNTSAGTAATSTAVPTQTGRGMWAYVAFALFVVAWGGNEFTPMMVFYRDEKIFNLVFVESLLACYAAGIVVALMLCGPLSDRFGRKVVMVPAPLVALLGSVLIALGETSEPLIFFGRVLSGMSIGATVTAGGSWIKELSVPEVDPTAREGSGAKRATMSLTLGFALGAAVAGCLAEWGPAPGQIPYIIHSALAALAFVGLLRVPDTRKISGKAPRQSFWKDLSVPTARHPRFLLIVLPIAPWVFGCGGVAYAIMPSLAQKGLDHPIAFSALVTAISLGVAFAIQQFAQHYTSAKDARGPQLGLIFVFFGMICAAFTAHHVTIWGVLLVAVLLGCGYGVCLISGLGEVQRLAGANKAANDLGGLTALFYAATYIGFFFPMILRRMNEHFTYPMMLGAGAVVAAVFFVLVTAFSKKYLPQEQAEG